MDIELLISCNIFNIFKGDDTKKSEEKTSSLSSAVESHHIQCCKKYQFFVTHVNGIPPKFNAGVSFDIKGKIQCI